MCSSLSKAATKWDFVCKVSARTFMPLSLLWFKCIHANVSAQGNSMLCYFWTLTMCSVELAHFSRSGLTAEANFVCSRYIPPLLWGKSGHLQTALYGKLGRVSSPHPSGVRKYLPMQDGATATFDLFEPIGDHRTGGNASDQDLCFMHRPFVLTGCS